MAPQGLGHSGGGVRGSENLHKNPSIADARAPSPNTRRPYLWQHIVLRDVFLVVLPVQAALEWHQLWGQHCPALETRRRHVDHDARPALLLRGSQGGSVSSVSLFRARLPVNPHNLRRVSISRCVESALVGPKHFALAELALLSSPEFLFGLCRPYSATFLRSHARLFPPELRPVGFVLNLSANGLLLPAVCLGPQPVRVDLCSGVAVQICGVSVRGRFRHDHFLVPAPAAVRVNVF